MYTNEKYEAFLKASDEIELGDNKVLLTQIKEFYKKIRAKPHKKDLSIIAENVI